MREIVETEIVADELFYQLALSLVPGVGPVVGKSLIAYCGSASAVFTESQSRLAKIPGAGPMVAGCIHRFTDFQVAEQEMEFAIRNEIRVLPYTSKDYPIRLKQVPDSPLILFVKGETNFNHDRMVGIVGTRKNTIHGAEITKKLVEGLAGYNAYTISGLAYGIDICAHKASLEYRVPTIAVLAHGLDLLYPGQHFRTAQQMIEQGGSLVSEFISGTPMNKDLFPRRNRIVAGMCDCVVVVESMGKGGSMITAEMASDYNRDVFAVPGRPTDIMSEGCNMLIKNLKAGLCETAIDIGNGMNWESNTSKAAEKQIRMFEELTEDEAMVVEVLHKQNGTYENLLLETGIPVNRLSVLLVEMEMKGIIRGLPGKQYAI